MLWYFFFWFSCDSLMQNSHFEIYFLAPIVIQRPREVTKGRTFPPPTLINNAPSWRGRRDEPSCLRAKEIGDVCTQATSPEVIRVATGDLTIKKAYDTICLGRLHQTCFGRVVGVWGRRESIAFFMRRHYTACNPPFLLKSVEFLSQPARLQTTTLRYNIKGIGTSRREKTVSYFTCKIFSKKPVGKVGDRLDYHN